MTNYLQFNSNQGKAIGAMHGLQLARKGEKQNTGRKLNELSNKLVY